MDAESDGTLRYATYYLLSNVTYDCRAFGLENVLIVLRNMSYIFHTLLSAVTFESY